MSVTATSPKTVSATVNVAASEAVVQETADAVVSPPVIDALAVTTGP